MVNFYIKAIAISGPSIVVDYEIVMSNATFEGAIGGGRTEIPVSALEDSIDALKAELENYIEKTVGVTPMDKPKSQQQEEDPL